MDEPHGQRPSQVAFSSAGVEAILINCALQKFWALEDSARANGNILAAAKIIRFVEACSRLGLKLRNNRYGLRPYTKHNFGELSVYVGEVGIDSFKVIDFDFSYEADSPGENNHLNGRTLAEQRAIATLLMMPHVGIRPHAFQSRIQENFIVYIGFWEATDGTRHRKFSPVLAIKPPHQSAALRAAKRTKVILEDGCMFDIKAKENRDESTTYSQCIDIPDAVVVEVLGAASGGSRLDLGIPPVYGSWVCNWLSHTPDGDATDPREGLLMNPIISDVSAVLAKPAEPKQT